jgi:hypothetical protein
MIPILVPFYLAPKLQEIKNHGRDRMVVGFTIIYAISAYHHKRCEFESCSGEVYLIQHYVIKFVVVYPGRMKNETTELLTLQQLCP